MSIFSKDALLVHNTQISYWFRIKGLINKHWVWKSLKRKVKKAQSKHLKHWWWVSEWERPCTELVSCCQKPSSEYKHLGKPFCTHGFHWGLERHHCTQTWVASRVSNTSHHSILAFGYALYEHSPPSIEIKQKHQIIPTDMIMNVIRGTLTHQQHNK